MRGVLKSADRGRTRLDWLDGRHSFSFGDYHDPAWMGFGPLRVINEDVVAPGAGFPLHPHRDMEIFTYMLSGSLAHRDSLGSGSTIEAGQVQFMRAGRGIRHSEFNPSPDTPAHLLQIWIMPHTRGLEPGYEERRFDLTPGRLVPLAAPGGTEGAFDIAQDARLLAARLNGGQSVTLETKAERGLWVQIARGSVSADSQDLEAGDAFYVAGEDAALEFRASQEAEFVAFDVAL